MLFYTVVCVCVCKRSEVIHCIFCVTRLQFVSLIPQTCHSSENTESIQMFCVMKERDRRSVPVGQKEKGY